MSSSNKLKPPKWGLIFALIVIGSLFVISLFAVLDSLLGEQEKLNAYGYTWLAFAAFNLFLFLIRKDLVSLSFLLINLTIASSYLSDYKGIFIIIPLIILYLFYFYLLYVNHRLNANYRQLLELAAHPVEDTDDGFTSRPLPAGKITLSTEELSAFARFLKKHYIAFPCAEKDNVIFTIKDHRRFWFGRPDELKDSYVAIDLKGNMTVNISRKDYQKYREEYSFEGLCLSLGTVFKRFFEFFHLGQAQKILEILSEENSDEITLN